jgi:hypothetical protein
VRRIGIIAALVFVLTVVAANWAVDEYGLLTVAPGLLALLTVFSFTVLAALLAALHP